MIHKEMIMKYIITFVLMPTCLIALPPLHECDDPDELYYRSLSINYSTVYINNCIQIMAHYPETRLEIMGEIQDCCEDIHNQLGMYPDDCFKTD